MFAQFLLPRFGSRAEARFFWSCNDERKFAMRQVFMFFGVFAFALHGVLDVAAGGDEKWILLALRGVCVAVMLSIAIRFSNNGREQGADRLLLAYMYTPAITIIIMSATVTEATAANTYPFGLVILAAYCATVLSPRCVRSAIFSLVTFTLFLASVPFSSISSSALIVNLFFVFVGLVAVTLGTLTRERLERATAMAEQSLMGMNQDLEVSRLEAIASRDTAIDAQQSQAKFIASVSHELRTPLNAIIGFSDLILNEIEGPIAQASYQDYIGDIHRSGQGLLLNINDLLDVQRLMTGKMSWSDARFVLDQMVRNAMAVCRYDAESAGVTLTYEEPADAIDAFGDSARMTQVITNLLTNAAKFTDAGGSVTIRQSLTDTQDYLIEVTDTGIGITPEDLARIRHPFEQAGDSEAAKKKGGLGLGLAIVEGILEQIGGRFDIESTYGVGTTCRVTIPANRLFLDDRMRDAANA